MRTSHETGWLMRGIQGALGGGVATGTMSLALGIADWLGIMNHQPPEKIIQTLLPGLHRDVTDVVAVAAHIGYGTTAGVAYGALVRPRHRSAGTGIAYGLAIWALGYEGWLPAMGVLPPAHRDKPGRAVTMLLAHVVYGATLGITGRRIAGRRAEVREDEASSASRPAAAGRTN